MEEIVHRTFSVWDYLVFSLVLVVSAVIGVFFGCTGSKQGSTKEFLMADRQMEVLPVSLSLLASFMSAIMILGTPTEIYLFGTQYMFIGVGYCLVAPATAYLFIPTLYKLRLTSAYEYLELRFKNRAIKIAGSLVFTFQMVLYLAIVLYAPSLALNAVTGLNVWVSVFSVGCVCTFYTSLGGMKAVMWTDVFQMVMMVAGLLAVVVQGCRQAGGINNVINILIDGERVRFFDINPDPGVRHTVWSLSFGALFMWLAINGVNQSQVQRALTCPTLKKAQVAVMAMTPGLIVLLLLTSFAGMAMYAFYEGCDPVKNKEIQANDQMLPLFVMDALGHLPGLPGLFVACMFSGTLSTISSGLNSLAAVTIHDLVKGHFYPDIPDERATRWSKLLAFGYGLLMIVLTFVAAQLGGVLQAALALFGILGGPLLGVFCLGLFFPRANYKGAFAGGAVALILCLWIGIGAVIVKPPLPAAPLSMENCPVGNYSMHFNQSKPINTSNIYNSYIDSNTMSSDFVLRSTEASIHPTAKSSRNPRQYSSTPDYRDGWDHFYSLSYLWYSLFAVIVVCGIGYPISVFTGGSADDVDPMTVCPIFDILFPCLPESWRVWLWFGVDHSQSENMKNQPDIDETKMPLDSPVEQYDLDEKMASLDV